MIRSLKDRALIFNEILDYRLNHTLKNVMSDLGVDCILEIDKEYNEGPLFKYLVPFEYLTARRLTILVLYFNGTDILRYSISMKDDDLDKYYLNIYDLNKSQMECLDELLIKLNPNKIAISKSNNYAYFDGLSHSLYLDLMNNLSEINTNKFISIEDIGIRFFERRSDLELEIYKEVIDLSLSIIEEVYSKEIIKPGITKTQDIEWYMKERVKSYGLDYWFDPDVNLQNKDSDNPMYEGVINKGDLLHLDFGISYMGLCSDIQRLCYVLKDDEDDAPLELKEAFKENMRFHEIVKNNFILDRTGNEILKASLNEAKENNIKAMLYTHPIGNFGHSAGVTIGLFSNQDAIYPSGNLKLHDKTCYALELNTKTYLKMYDKEIYIFTEESTVFKDGKLEYISNNHPKLYTI